jgi:hypothetical protein
MVENGTAVVLDLGAGMTLGVCFDDQQEGRFVEMGGDLYAFSNETVLTNRTVTDKNLQIEPNLRLRSITERASIAENSDDFMRGRRRYPKHIYAVAGLCAFLITLVLVELYRGFR